jgi:hypothetical protein
MPAAFFMPEKGGGEKGKRGKEFEKAGKKGIKK